MRVNLWENKRKEYTQLFLVHLRRIIILLPHLSIEMSIFLLVAHVAAGQIPGPIMESQDQGKGLAFIIKDQSGWGMPLAPAYGM